MGSKRARLHLARAASRIRIDAWDDLWPDALSLYWLPRDAADFNAARRRIAALRDGRRRFARGREALVPKPNGLMRPAQQLNPDARLYYQAIVDSFMYDIDRRVVGKNHVFGYRPLAPRSTNAPFGFGLHQWKRFRAQLRAEVVSGRYGAMVRTDLAAFFERIPHGALEERLTSLGVRDDVAKELRGFLKLTMGKAHGLPQGPDPSGLLASIYLHPLDQAIIGAGYGYVRYVDDIVILADDATEAKRALRMLEAEARRLDLIIQSAKTELVVGHASMLAAVSDDDEIAGIDYVVSLGAPAIGKKTVHDAWKEATRKQASRRLLKYLINRLADARDDIALRWSLAHLGVLDYEAATIARYISRFANRKVVQNRIGSHLGSPDNISEWEEMNLLRAMLSAKAVRRPILARSRTVAANRNAGQEVRQFAILLLGRHGDPSDHAFVARESLDDEALAVAALVALRDADAKMRGRHIADVLSRFPEAKRFAARVKAAAKTPWPEFR